MASRKNYKKNNGNYNDIIEEEQKKNNNKNKYGEYCEECGGYLNLSNNKKY